MHSHRLVAMDIRAEAPYSTLSQDLVPMFQQDSAVNASLIYNKDLVDTHTFVDTDPSLVATTIFLSKFRDQ
ncbi:hypothetical protein L484_021735 [Morus notabilis]|uniref:Uncharacterized protein n=1 Tax=Morus notabilis TaxID=981085 RepID=W9SKQ0_9ROSA|nr:hypothetical protein L484_021735 [Morus notabilis]